MVAATVDLILAAKSSLVAITNDIIPVHTISAVAIGSELYRCDCGCANRAVLLVQYSVDCLIEYSSIQLIPEVAIYNFIEWSKTNGHPSLHSNL